MVILDRIPHRGGRQSGWDGAREPPEPAASPLPQRLSFVPVSTCADCQARGWLFHVWSAQAGDLNAPPCAAAGLIEVFRSGGDLLAEPVEDAFAAYAGRGGFTM